MNIGMGFLKDDTKLKQRNCGEVAAKDEKSSCRVVKNCSCTKGWHWELKDGLQGYHRGL